MKKLIIVFLLLSSFALATTTVTGNIRNLGTGTIGSGAFVRFWLRGCAGNQPRINGTGIIAPSQGGVFFFDFPANTSGTISGTLYSTRDSTGLLGGDIECGGSTTAVWYGMQAYFAGKGGPEVPVHAKNTASLDISNVTPITTNPVIASPTGDSTYLRLDAGNSPITGGLNTVAYQYGTVTGTAPIGKNVGVYAQPFNDTLFAVRRVSTTSNTPVNFVRAAGVFEEALAASGSDCSGGDANNYNASNTLLVSTVMCDNANTSTINAEAIIATIVGGGLRGSFFPLEVDLNNQSGTDATSFDSSDFTGDTFNAGILSTSVGNKKGGIGAIIKSNNAGAGNWQRGLLVQDFTAAGVHIKNTNGGSTAGQYALIIEDTVGGNSSDITWTNGGDPSTSANIKWIVGKNSSNDWSVFDSANSFTRFVASAGSNGNTTVAAPGSGVVKITSNSVTANATQTIASGTAAMPTGAVAAISGTTVTCVAAGGNPFTATGVLTTDTITWSPNAAESSPNTGLIIRAWPTSGGVNFEYCNPTASNLTPSAETLNWRVIR